MTTGTSYRESHLGTEKARAYHLTFSENPYRKMIWEFEQQILTGIVRRFFGQNSFSHLDFACGTGRVISCLKSDAKTSIGVDVSPSMLEVARTTHPDLEFIQADLTTESILSDRAFDLITAFRFFPHAEPDLRLSAMKALTSRLAPDGYLVFNNHKHTGSLGNRLARLVGRRKGYAGMSMSQVSQLLQECDLRLVAVHHVAVLPVSESRIILPIRVLRAVEALLSRIPALSKFGEDLIFVCQHSTGRTA